MDNTDSVATLIDSTASKMQQLQQAFSQLEGHSAFLMNLKWKQLEDHFHGLEKSLKKRFDELEDQEREYAESLRKSQEMLEKQESVVVAKELTSLERLQQKRDAALLKIFDKPNILCPMSSNSTCNAIKSMPSVKAGNVVSLGNLDVKPNAFTEQSSSSAKDRSEIAVLCEDKNVDGLYKFISDNRKNLSAIREELLIALKGSADPYNLVLDFLGGFYSGENVVLDGKKDADLLGVRRTCLMLMESLGQLQTETGFFGDNFQLTPATIERAKLISSGWKSKLDILDLDASNGNSLEAHAFLQLIATFSIASEFGEDELCKLIPSVSRRRQTPELCRLLGLSDKVRGAIEILLNTGRQLDGINLAYSFGLTDQFAPVPLLKAYLKEVKKGSHVKNGSLSPSAQNEMNERELSALRAVIKCIEEHKLEEEYPVDPLQKRIDQLEKAKADKRRAAEASKPQSKRARANGSIYAPRVTALPDKSFYATPERQHPYAYDLQYGYPPEAHHPVMMTPAPYISPPPATFYGNGYQVPYQFPYIH